MLASVYAFSLLTAPVLAASPAATTTAQPPIGATQTPPPAEKPQTTGGATTSESGTGAQSTLPTDKGTGGGNSGNKQ